MFVTVDARVHNDRCEMTFSWVSENCLWVFRKQKDACVSVGYTTLTDDKCYTLDAICLRYRFMCVSVSTLLMRLMRC